MRKMTLRRRISISRSEISFRMQTGMKLVHLVREENSKDLRSGFKNAHTYTNLAIGPFQS
jgi:hypothetical protein